MMHINNSLFPGADLYDGIESKAGKLRLNIYERIFVFIYLLIPLVDSVNGYFLLNNISTPISIGQLYRFLITFLFLLVIFKFAKKIDFYKFLFFSMVLVMLQFVYFFKHANLSGMFFDISNIIKLLFIIITIEGYRALYKSGKIRGIIIVRILKISIFTFPISILIPKLLGVGFTAYSNGGGYSAFYNANNDLNIVLIILLIFSLELVFQGIRNKDKKNVLYIIGLLLIITVTLLVGSKSSMAFSVISILIYSFRSIKSNSVLKNFNLFLLISLVAFVLIRLSYLFQNEINGIIERNKYFFNKSENILGFLLSGREIFLENAYYSFINSEHIITRLIIGVGSYAKNLELGQLLNTGTKVIEMDIFDIFFAYGLIGTILIYSYFIIIFIKACKIEFVYKYLYLSVFVFSTIVGHVLFSALSGSFLAIICCMFISSSGNKKFERDT
ncbi:hypothetical protein CEQ21_15045 [Niallia circulans]|uniref:Uncharacterized protein n=1 Tax=Niallia circulans TaxID=1397 RepID=A0A553SIK5_NIACI|nr:O-antigen ligase family protein [Niallia circulans]TRZ36824.1 hypothetical protein CEQ21_15045 [Niallia circulans]